MRCMWCIWQISCLSHSQTFQIFEPLNIDILPKAYSWQKEYSKSTTVERLRENQWRNKLAKPSSAEFCNSEVSFWGIYMDNMEKMTILIFGWGRGGFGEYWTFTFYLPSVKLVIAATILSKKLFCESQEQRWARGRPGSSVRPPIIPHKSCTGPLPYPLHVPSSSSSASMSNTLAPLTQQS